MIIDLIASRMSFDEILEDYPDLERADLSAVLTFPRPVIEIKRLDLAA